MPPESLEAAWREGWGAGGVVLSLFGQGAAAARQCGFQASETRLDVAPMHVAKGLTCCCLNVHGLGGLPLRLPSCMERGSGGL